MIRAVCPQDRDCFLQLADEFYHSPGVLHTIPREHMERTFEQLVTESPYVKGWIFWEDEEPAGYGLVSLTWSQEAGGMVAWLEELYIRPEHQGKGLGSAFFRYFEESYGQDLARIRLEVEPENHRAAQLYERLGYQPLAYQQMYKEWREPEQI